MNKNKLNTTEQNKKQLLKEAIEAGEESGYLDNFDPVKHLEELNSIDNNLNTNSSGRLH